MIDCRNPLEWIYRPLHITGSVMFGAVHLTTLKNFMKENPEVFVIVSKILLYREHYFNDYSETELGFLLWKE